MEVLRELAAAGVTIPDAALAAAQQAAAATLRLAKVALDEARRFKTFSKDDETMTLNLIRQHSGSMLLMLVDPTLLHRYVDAVPRATVDEEHRVAVFNGVPGCADVASFEVFSPLHDVIGGSRTISDIPKLVAQLSRLRSVREEPKKMMAWVGGAEEVQAVRELTVILLDTSESMLLRWLFDSAAAGEESTTALEDAIAGGNSKDVRYSDEANTLFHSRNASIAALDGMEEARVLKGLEQHPHITCFRFLAQREGSTVCKGVEHVMHELGL